MDVEIDGMGRMLRFLRQHQRRGGTRRLSDRAIGRAVDLSHTEIKRLKDDAKMRGWLVPDVSGTGYKRIAVEESLPGRRWIPAVTCSWKEPIEWRAKEGEGESVSVKRFSLRPRKDIWMVEFASWEPVTTDYPPRLGPGVIAYVRLLKHPSDVRVGDWCLVSMYGRVKSMFRVAGGAFRRACDLTWKNPRIELEEVDQVAVIEAWHAPCTRRQNKIRLQVSETVSVIADSPLVHKENRPAVGIVNVDTQKLRRVLQKRSKVGKRCFR